MAVGSSPLIVLLMMVATVAAAGCALPSTDGSTVYRDADGNTVAVDDGDVCSIVRSNADGRRSASLICGDEKHIGDRSVDLSGCAPEETEALLYFSGEVKAGLLAVRALAGGVETYSMEMSTGSEFVSEDLPSATAYEVDVTPSSDFRGSVMVQLHCVAA